jgi:Mn-dependent DtxR family transcriptional regulator
MDLNQLERELLTALAAEWDHSGPPGFVETAVVSKRLNISIEDAKSAIRSLFVKGLVDTDKVDIFAAYLTPEGYEKARDDQKPSQK